MSARISRRQLLLVAALTSTLLIAACSNAAETPLPAEEAVPAETAPAADPANLLGTVMPGPKAARVAGSRVLYRDGVPIASLVAGQVELLQALTQEEARDAHRALSSDAPSRVAELVAQQVSG